MTNEQTARIVVDFDQDPRCVSCGDYQSYCDSVDCFAVLNRHDSGDHGGCDMLVCEDVRQAAVYIPQHKLGGVS